ncbi:ankyrin repeat-containing domain protein [Colletotrichum godetiae]|uniref:Ankyrin repeat-containing domain protein n=1 Tax=Colletotrichum godetiae TaxID=1209918 RepID=A0AAJ0B1B8_9PEZI|nr:ankyrin repeat-containing domain protein [Colletotrichum godetiae]KAK1700628.1 ankyrin repeat-containing domain protein [Colletotrichum godetiae]
MPCETALSGAVSNGHFDVTVILLQAGAVVSLSYVGADVLARAMARGFGAAVELLLSKSIQVGEWALEEAFKGISPRISDMLLDKISDVDAVAYFSNALLPASQEGHYDLTKALLERGAKTNVTDASGMSALSLAAGNGHESVFKLLLHHEALNFIDVNYKCHPLYAASRAGHSKIIQLLPLDDIGLDIIYESAVVALQFGSFDAVELLLKRFNPCQLGIQYNVLVEATRAAVRRGNHRLVKLLLQYGVDANTMGSNGSSLLHNMFIPERAPLGEKSVRIGFSRRMAMADLLLQYGARGSTPSPDAFGHVKQQYVEMVHALQSKVMFRERAGGRDFIPYQVSLETLEDGEIRLHVSR